jgi:hypothetical protein
MKKVVVVCFLQILIDFGCQLSYAPNIRRTQYEYGTGAYGDGSRNNIIGYID